MAARLSRVLHLRNKALFSGIRRLAQWETLQSNGPLRQYCVRTVLYEKAQAVRYSKAKTWITNHGIHDAYIVTCQRSITTFSRANDSSIDKEQVLDYKSIPRLVQESLANKGHKDDVIQSQIAILNKLMQVREKTANIDAVKEMTDKLPDKLVYELAATVFGLSSIVGEDAIAMSAPLFRFASLAGNTDAKYTYAKLLQLGEGVSPDPIEAGKMFKELAEKGHPFAQFSLGQLHYAGVGVDQNFKIALELFELSAKNGILPAYSQLGNMYRTGQGVEENPEKAFQIFKEGADKGDISALMAVAYCYSHGVGVQEDSCKSFEFHKKAADQGYASAQYNVGVHYFAGRGVQLDMKLAAEYFQLAAQQGFELAQINLGNMYYNGLGVEKNLLKAQELYQQASRTNPNAKLLLEELESELKGKDDDKNS
ncbi:sel1-repeat-containing protein YbeQ [Nematostella vectensis]|uniref:sel1-repeat-containing protein YbeQ n=1 Tax=Nematostella vectensis TaxID=45351 RepID=UPI0020771671|nr:sel1-repeat-containing protein YbeQ [Nematostella vectensis]